MARAGVAKVYRIDREPGMRFEDIPAAFARSRRAGMYGATKICRESSIQSYEKDFRSMFAYFKDKGHVSWNDITESDMNAFIDSIQTSTWMLASKNHVLRTLKALNFWIERDPACHGMQSWRRLIPRIPKNPAKVWIPSPQTMSQFLNGFTQSKLLWDFRDYVITCLMLDCGPRVGEVSFLALDHLRLDANTILMPDEGKTGTRVVFIHPVNTVPLIQRWLSMRTAIAKKEFVFVNKWGGQLSTSGIWQSFERNRIRTGITEQITPHTLRHYFATHYLVNGGSLQSLKQILGHECYETLNIYIRMADQMTNIAEEHKRVSPLQSLQQMSAPEKKKRRTV